MDMLYVIMKVLKLDFDAGSLFEAGPYNHVIMYSCRVEGDVLLILSCVQESLFKFFN